MKNILLLTLSFFFFNSISAQIFQWGIRGGSTSLTNPYDESVTDMATDPAGNVYALSIVGQTALNVDGHAKTNYGGLDILLSSFTCNGTYRWSKDIGAYTTDLARALKTDSLGGVYITDLNLYSIPNNGHIDTDTTLSALTEKKMFLLKYDTAGNYKWLVMPQADTVGPANISNTYALDMDVDGGGNIYWLCLLAPGAYANGAYIADSQAAYILKYDKNGFFQNGFKMDLHYTGVGIAGMKIKHSGSGKYYCSGGLESGSLNIGGYQLTNTMYACSFNSTGQMIWVKQNANVTSAMSGRQTLDANNNIYITGGIAGNDTMCSLPLTGGPFILAIDSNGNGLWNKCATVNASCGGYTTTLRNNDEVVVSGAYPGYLSWPGYSGALNLPPNSGYSIFITRFNSHTGQVLGLDSIASNFGYDEFPASMTADNKGNVYIGGQFASEMYIGGDTIQSIGGETDFFVAKYGFANCSCTATPTANYTYTINHDAVSFTYSGVTPYDSLQWTFGDPASGGAGGDTSSLADPVHTYTTSGTYYACVTVYNSCGSNTYCDTVRPGLGVAPVNAMDNITAYPNPGTDEIYIKGITAQTDYVMQNAIGVTVSKGILTATNNIINMSRTCGTPGVYLLQLTDSNGNKKVIRLVKE